MFIIFQVSVYYKDLYKQAADHCYQITKRWMHEILHSIQVMGPHVKVNVFYQPFTDRCCTLHFPPVMLSDVCLKKCDEGKNNKHFKSLPLSSWRINSMDFHDHQSFVMLADGYALLYFWIIYDRYLPMILLGHLSWGLPASCWYNDYNVFPFSRPIRSFDWPFPFDLKGKSMENRLSLCCLNDWQSYQRNRREKNSCLEKQCDRLLKGCWRWGLMSVTGLK